METSTLKSNLDSPPRYHNSPPRSRDAFLHARPWQFPGDGRKHKIVKERERRLTRVLARFDPSGNCRNIYSAIETIVREVKARESNYSEAQRLEWSRRTVCRYLAGLKSAGIISCDGLTTMHGTRRRILHPQALLSVPPESGTPASRQYGTRSFLDSKKLQLSRKKRADTSRAKTARGASPSVFDTKIAKKHQRPTRNPNPSCQGKANSKPNPRHDAGLLPSVAVSELRKPENAEPLILSLGRELQVETDHAVLLFEWACRPTARDPHCERRVRFPQNYVLSCAVNFERSFEDYQQGAILDRFCDDAQKTLDAIAAYQAPPVPESLPGRIETEKKSRTEARGQTQQEAYDLYYCQISPPAEVPMLSFHSSDPAEAQAASDPHAWERKYATYWCEPCRVTVRVADRDSHAKHCKGRPAEEPLSPEEILSLVRNARVEFSRRE